MKVLLTGHLGYIGAVTGKVLQNAGISVSGVDADLFRDSKFSAFSAVSPLGEISDIRDLTSDHLSSFDAVINLAALSNDPLGDISPRSTHEINHHAAVNLAERSREAGVRRFIQASTCSVYGGAGDRWVDEETEPMPLTDYAVSKWKAELNVLELARDGFTPMTLRFGTAYGPSPMLRTDLVVNNLLAHLVESGEVRLLSDGSSWRPIIHVEDIARCYLYLLKSPDSRFVSQVFNVGRLEENIRISDLAMTIAEVVPNSRVTKTNPSTRDRRSYRVRFERFQKAFPDFEMKWSIKRGVSDLFDLYGKSEGAFSEGWQERWGRVSRLKQLLESGSLSKDLRWAKK